jgi:hypothetical protein
VKSFSTHDQSKATLVEQIELLAKLLDYFLRSNKSLATSIKKNRTPKEKYMRQRGRGPTNKPVALLE